MASTEPKFTPGTASVLMAFPRQGGPTLSAEDLAPATGVHVDRVVSCLENLHRLKIVVRVSRDYGRKSLWRLSAQGRKVVKALVAAV